MTGYGAAGSNGEKTSVNCPAAPELKKIAAASYARITDISLLNKLPAYDAAGSLYLLTCPVPAVYSEKKSHVHERYFKHSRPSKKTAAVLQV